MGARHILVLVVWYNCQSLTLPHTCFCCPSIEVTVLLVTALVFLPLEFTFITLMLLDTFRGWIRINFIA